MSKRVERTEQRAESCISPVPRFPSPLCDDLCVTPWPLVQWDRGTDSGWARNPWSWVLTATNQRRHGESQCKETYRCPYERMSVAADSTRFCTEQKHLVANWLFGHIDTKWTGCAPTRSFNSLHCKRICEEDQQRTHSTCANGIYSHSPTGRRRLNCKKRLNNWRLCRPRRIYWNDRLKGLKERIVKMIKNMIKLWKTGEIKAYERTTRNIRR